MQVRVIYKFSCSGCNFTYVGMTNHYLRTCTCEHMVISPLLGAAIRTAVSFVYDHLLKTGHHSNQDDFLILCKLLDQSTLPIREYIYNKKY